MIRSIARVATLLLLLVFKLSSANAQWSQVGDTMHSEFIQLAAAPDGTLYVGYSIGNTGFSIRRFNSSTWESLSGLPVAGSRYPLKMATDRSGTLHIATDTFDHAARVSRPLILKYTGQGWLPVGDVSRFPRAVQGIDAALVFDAGNRPCYAFENTVVHFNGVSWDLIAGSTAPVQYRAMVADTGGIFYLATGDSLISKYAGNGSWTGLSRRGLEQVGADASILAAASNGQLYLAHLGVSSGDSSSIHRYDGQQWQQLGKKFAPSALSSVQIGANGAPYAVQRSGENIDSIRVLRYSGGGWHHVASDTGVYFSDLVADRAGSLYVAITEKIGKGSCRVMKFDTRKDALSVPPADISNAVSLAPVPAEHMVVVRCNNVALTGKLAQVIDLRGRVVHRFLLAPECRIDMSSWPAGVFHVLLPQGQALRFVRK